MSTLKPWTQVVIPHSDIRSGRFDEAVFAADLSDVVANRGPLEYRDAAMFFRKTYPAKGLVQLLASVMKRLSGQGDGEAVIQIQTPFGGGKTHSLIALYHLIKHGQELGGAIAELLQKAGVERVPEARVVTFVGTAADPISGRTPWGEIAHQLGRYELLEAHDRKRRAPGKDLLHQLLSAQPTLLLMDEIAEYAVKARDFRDQLVAFYQELTEAVKVLPQSVLVVTLPSSAPYGEEGERALRELQRVFGRVESIRTPVEGEEIYEVIRRRLFEHVGDPEDIRRTVEGFFEMYHQLGDDVPREVREPAYRERMRKAYPFHPEVIDVLFERWSTFSDFQRTRGVLRLLALVVSQLYRAQHPAPLILPAHLDVSQPGIRGELLRHIGNEYQGVIASDIAAGGNAKAERIDREVGSEYERYNVASGIARAIFFMSFSGGGQQGVGLQRLRLSVLQPGLKSAIVGDVLLRLRDELWYLHEEKGVYRFYNRPNLNRVIVEKEEAIKPEAVMEEMQQRLEKLAGNAMQVILWPRASQDVPDTKALKLAILSPEHAYSREETNALVRELLDKCGRNFRVYRNTLLLLAADANELDGLCRSLKRYLAYRAVQEDKGLWQQLSEENRRAVETKISDADGIVSHRLVSAYRHLAKAEANEQGVAWFDLGLSTSGKRPSLTHRVREYLIGEDLLLEKLSPNYLMSSAMGADDQEKPAKEIYEAFLRYPNLPMLESSQVILGALREGVERGAFGIRVGDSVYEKTLPEALLEQLLEQGTLVVRKPAPETARNPEPKLSEKEEGTPSLGREQHQQRSLKLDFVIGWDKVAEFVSGVLRPIHSANAELTVRIILEARGAIPDAVLSAVDETLRQIGARIEQRQLTPLA